MKPLVLPVLASLLLMSCSSTPVAEPLIPAAASAGEPAPPQLCVVSLDGGAATCPEPLTPPPVPESTEPCVERADDNAFTHGPGRRIYAFCTPKESARRAADAVRGDAKD